MDVLPAAVLALPDTGLFHGTGHRRAIAGHSLVKAHIADHGHVPHDPNMRGSHGCGVMPLSGAEFEVKLVKVQAFHQLPERLGLKAGNRRVAELSVFVPVGGHDGVEQLLVQFEDFSGTGVGHDDSPA